MILRILLFQNWRNLHMRRVQKLCNCFSFRGMLTYSANNFQNTMWCLKLFFSQRQCVWLEKHICAVCFLRLVCQVTRNKKHVLKIPSPKANSSNWGGSGRSSFTFFVLTPCVALLSLDLNPVQKSTSPGKDCARVLCLHGAVHSQQYWPYNP